MARTSSPIFLVHVEITSLIRSRKLVIPLFVVVLFACVHMSYIAQAVAAENEFLDFDLSQLMHVKVTSVSKKPQELADSPAAVFVISQEDIRRSGVTSIPEALRLAPGLQVARISSNKWAITSRGFNGFFANKLLVLMDGRSVYTPSFSGVYWDSQDYMLEDVDRIEVIRGPGATMWGANAVNGVINIISKKAQETVGGMVSLGGGNQNKGLTGVRYGQQVSEAVAGRVYFKAHERDDSELAGSDLDGGDAGTTFQGGVRLDGELGRDRWTVQGDFYRGDQNQHLVNLASLSPPWIYMAEDRYDVLGWNMLTRWQHEFTAGNMATLQMYYDVVEREEFYLNQDHATFDLDFQHQFSLDHNVIMWGLALRSIRSDFDNTFQARLIPSSFTHDLYSGFIQDEISLTDAVYLTVGTKVEHNDYTGVELQPSVRLLWQLDSQQRLWGAVSKGVRTPSEIEFYGNLVAYVIPPATTITLTGNDDFDAEEVIAYELGYRFSPVPALSMDLAFYYNDYDKLRSYNRLGTSDNFVNNMDGANYGLELATSWQAYDWLSLQMNYTYINGNFNIDSGTDRNSDSVIEGASPRHQVSLRTAIDLNDQWQCDFFMRYVDELEAASANAWNNSWVVDDYVELDISLTWVIRNDLKLQLVGQDLLNSSHLEFVQETFTARTEIKRSLFAKINWEF